ncbi:SdpI family protein, partial [Corynebacterium variabile]
MAAHCNRLLVMIVLSVLLFVLGIAVLVTGLMGLTGTLPGNRWVGLRIPEVRKSKDMWVTGHRIAGP